MVKPASQRARHANQHLHPHHIRRKTAAVAVAACFTTGVAIANPTAPTVVHGTVSMSQAGGILNITNSHNAIINWGSFSIGAGELTRFIQPSALSAVLNRVVGSDPSAILGALQSNGRVFLLNPNGIVFGSGAQINVAGLVASTLNLSNDDFLNNRMRFTDGAGAGSVVNQGNITGGSVYLIGNAVANKGLITSPNGEVVLAAGNSVELVSPGTPNLRVEVVAPANEAVNLGSISAEAGRVGIYAGLIKQGGTINADSAVAEGGRIMLKSTKSTVIEAGSVTTARGTSGGQIVALSGMTDGKTEVAGKLDASAIASGTPGAGGFIETSAAKVKIADSAVITAAGSGGGKAGTWLIDPTDFYISNAYGGDMSATFLSSTLNSYGSGTNVDIESTGGAGGSTGTIFVNDAVTWSSDSTLRLIAVGNVDVNSAITNTGAGGVQLFAGWTGSYDLSPVPVPIIGPTAAPSRNINLNAPISTGGDIHLIADGNIVQGAPGSLTASGLAAYSASGSVNLANPSATNTVSTVAGRAIGQFAIKNTGNLTVGTVGGASGIAAYGASPGLHATVNVDVTGGALTVANQIVAVGADGSEGQAGGNANISLSASNGITVNANITASAGHGGFSYGPAGDGGTATISLVNTGSPGSMIVVGNGVYVQANGGGGGDAFGSSGGGRGGDAVVTLTSSGGVTVEGQVQSWGGHGGSASSAGGGRAGDGIVNIAATGGNLLIAAYGGVIGQGGYGGSGEVSGGRGGDGAVTLTSGGNVTVSGTVRAFGGSGGSGSSGAGGRGGNAVVNVTAGGALTVDSMVNWAVKAEGGEGGIGYWNGDGGRGGDGTVNLTSAGLMTLGNSSTSYLDTVYARGGNGGHVDGGEGFAGGAGGQAKVEVTSAGGITVYANVAAQGGYGQAGSSGSSTFSRLGNGGSGIVMMTNNGSALFEQISGNIYANGGGGERAGDAIVTLVSAGGMTLNNTYADGGSGSTIPGGSARGGDATITLQNSSAATPLLISGTVRASGGEDTSSSGLFDGGNASVNVNSAGGLSIVGSVEAYGGRGENAGRGGAAAIQLTSTNTSVGVAIDGGEVFADGGNGGTNSAGVSGRGGDASVSVASAGGILVKRFVGASAGAGGSNSGFGAGDGGNASVTFTNTSSTAPIAVIRDYSTAYGIVGAEGGWGLTGGNAAIAMTSAAGFVLQQTSISAGGGQGYAESAATPAQGGTGSVVLTNTNAGADITAQNSVIYASGGSLSRSPGNGGSGGDAVVILSSAGGITLSNSFAGASGGNVNGSGGAPTDRGGAAGLTMLAGGNILIEGGEGSAWGGGGVTSGGNAAVNIVAGGNIQLEGGEGGSFRTHTLPGADSSLVVAAAGNLTIDGRMVMSDGLVGLGGANILVDNSADVWGGAGVQINASGSLTVTNNSFVGGDGIANVTTGGNVLVENNGIIVGNPDVVMKVGGEIFMNTGGQIYAGAPLTIHLTFPMLTSGGFTVNGIPGLVFDGSTGFFAGGSGAVLGTNLLITYGGGAELIVPTDTLIVAMNDSIKPPDAEKKKDIFEDENQAKKKKEAPVCR